MGVLSEDSRDFTQSGAALRDGLEVLDLNQEVPFTEYSRIVLPLDGYVFWVPVQRHMFNGSLHYSMRVEQNEDETAAISSVTFTSLQRCEHFETTPNNALYVGEHEGVRFAFSSRDSRYSQIGDLYHYSGQSIPPAMQTQLLDDPSRLDESQAVVSNSLPLVLAMNTTTLPYSGRFVSSGITLYPADLVPANLPPPYGAVSIGEDTEAVQSMPLIDAATQSDTQLAADHARITLYGLQNDAARDFLNFVIQYTLFTPFVNGSLQPPAFGLMNSPIVKDSRRPQPELQAIAMKKVLDLDISYNQRRAALMAQKLIRDARFSFVTI